MAKLAYSKLNLKPDVATVSMPWGDYEVEVRKYLPLEDKVEMISRIVNQSVDDNGFYNPLRVNLYLTLEVVYAYTNLSFTEKQKENPFKLYDSLVSSGFVTNLMAMMNETELDEVRNFTYEVIDNIYHFKNSVLGILETISTDYSNLDLNASEIQKKLADPENLEFLKGVLTKLG